MSERLDALRYEPIEKRIRALVGDDAVVDSTARCSSGSRGASCPPSPCRSRTCVASRARAGRGRLAQAPVVLHPGSRSPGALDPARACRCAPATPRARRVAFAPADPDLAGHVILDFTGFDRWLEEDEPLVGNARDPYHRHRHVPQLARGAHRARRRAAGAQHVRRLLFGDLACRPASTCRARTSWPSTAPATGDDLRVQGHAAYRRSTAGEGLAWTYEDPLPEAAPMPGPSPSSTRSST